jgi:enoyl-CoA hydratase/3-hydroxyacyl-CoA dehydrogenase
MERRLTVPAPYLRSMWVEAGPGEALGGGSTSMARKRRYDTIITEKEGRIEWITLNRPHRLNAFNLEMIDELSSAIHEAEEDEDVRCIIIKGAGDRAFSAGADLTMFTELTPTVARDASQKGQRLMGMIEASSKPYVAAIHGFCLGGGLELALACDFRIADESAELGNPEIRLGIIPGWGGTQRLCRIIGLAKAKELIMLGDRIPADEALRFGLVHKVVPVGKLLEEARALAQRLVEGPPVALKFAKYVMNLGTQFPLEVGLGLEANAFGVIASTEDVIEGISSFFEKRKPEFKGR